MQYFTDKTGENLTLFQVKIALFLYFCYSEYKNDKERRVAGCDFNYRNNEKNRRGKCIEN